MHLAIPRIEFALARPATMLFLELEKVGLRAAGDQHNKHEA
jgi:hypothetical protein